MFTLPHKTPEEDELVIYQVTGINHKLGFASTILPEFGNLEATLPFANLSRKRSARSVKKYVSVGRKDVGRVHALEVGVEGTLHPTLSRVGIEEEEKDVVQEAYGHRLRLIKWLGEISYHTGETSVQGLWDLLVTPLLGMKRLCGEEEETKSKEPWDVVRDCGAEVLMEEGGPWESLDPEWGGRLELFERARLKFFPKPPVKISVTFEARGPTVDALKEWAVATTNLVKGLSLAIVSPPHYVAVLEDVHPDEAKAKEAMIKEALLAKKGLVEISLV